MKMARGIRGMIKSERRMKTEYGTIMT